MEVPRRNSERFVFRYLEVDFSEAVCHRWVHWRFSFIEIPAEGEWRFSVLT
jgi:hypothetical protein